ncbi:MAG: glycerophosphodiester phosphodiesterase family protein [Thermodesulfobacteriota bacterium]
MSASGPPSTASTPAAPRGGQGGDFVRIAHRGASGECPENTLVAFRRALEQGAMMIECDLQLTADGHVVVFHDWTLERTTNGSGVVCELALEAIRRLDAGSWRDRRFAGEPVPTLGETLDLVLPAAALNLELKSRGTRDDARRLARAAVAAVAERGALDRVVFSSFDPVCVEAARAESDDARIGILWDDPPFDRAWQLAAASGAVALHPRASTVTPDLIRAAHERRLAVYVWTVNAPADMLRLARAGADGLMSDHPERLRDVAGRLRDPA